MATELSPSTPDELVMMFVVRRDLKMNRGKIAAQVAHATQDILIKVANEPDMIHRYLLGDATTKIVLGCQTYDEFKAIWTKCAELGIPHHLVADFGRTQVSPGTITVLGAGPRPKSELDAAFGGLKLLN